MPVYPSFRKFKNARILELEANPSKDALKKAYKDKSRVLHPDMPTGDEAKFQELKEAYEVLEELRTRPYSRAAAGRSEESPHVAAHREAQRFVTDVQRLGGRYTLDSVKDDG